MVVLPSKMNSGKLYQSQTYEPLVLDTGIDLTACDNPRILYQKPFGMGTGDWAAEVVSFSDLYPQGVDNSGLPANRFLKKVFTDENAPKEIGKWYVQACAFFEAKKRLGQWQPWELLRPLLLEVSAPEELPLLDENGNLITDEEDNQITSG